MSILIGIRWFFVLFFALLLFAEPVSAGIIITFDENGVGSIKSMTGGVTPMPGVLGTDADGHPTLIYTLPAGTNLTDGDLYLRDGSLTGPRGDVVRFHGGTICFYSDGQENGETQAQLGDVGIPVHLKANQKDVLEVGAEGSNGAVYMPKAGEPGFDPGQKVTVNVISDTPEPSSIILAVSGALIVFVSSAWRRLIARSSSPIATAISR